MDKSVDFKNQKFDFLASLDLFCTTKIPLRHFNLAGFIATPPQTS